MPRTAQRTTFELPTSIAGLWGLCALTPFRSRAAYEEAATLCGKFAVRRLNTVQREYFHELQALVDEWEDRHGEAAKALGALTALSSGIEAPIGTNLHHEHRPHPHPHGHL
jgi:hypothetical protein